MRYYAPHIDRKPVKQQGGLTLEQAQKHCQLETTRKEGEWFEGYQQES